MKWRGLAEDGSRQRSAMRRAMPPEKYCVRESVKVPQESRRKGLSQRMFSVPGSAGFRCVQEGGEDGFGGAAAGGADRLRSSPLCHRRPRIRFLFIGSRLCSTLL